MVQGLLIRQIFMVIDILLAIGIVVIAPFIVLSAVGKGPDISDLLTPQATLASDVDAGAKISKVGVRTIYRTIMENGLFGAAGRYNIDATPPPPPPAEIQNEIEETTLDLVLIGTTVFDDLSSAIIENKENGTTITCLLNRTIVENVTLLEVRQREIIILNERENPAATQKLTFIDDKNKEEVMARGNSIVPRVSAPTEVVNLNRNELIQELYESYADLVTKVKPEVVKDNSGKVIGYTAQNISDIPIAKKLGLADGDVLQSVNNESIDSEQKIMQLVQKYRNSGSVRIGIMRNGKKKTVTYNLQ